MGLPPDAPRARIQVVADAIKLSEGERRRLRLAGLLDDV
jgi:hypothetical protein